MVNQDTENNDEILTEEIASEGTEPAAEEQDLEEIESLEEGKLQSLKDKVKRLEEEKRTAQEELALAKADFLNARKRLEEDKLRGIERQKVKDIEALLPLCDAFTMAMANQDAWNAVDENWRKGVEGIYSNLEGILKGHNVESFDPTGEPFDPELHEALSTTESDQETDTVVTTVQQGYKLGDMVIRPAKVVIST